MYNYGKTKKTRSLRSEDDHGGFQHQFSQQLVNRYEHINSRNELWMMRLKAIEAEYYSIEN